MARPQNRKRQHPDDLSQDPHPSKKIKSRGHYDSLNFSPEFWDNLSKVWLTPRALRELDRRNNIRLPTKPTTPEEVYSKDLARYARHGGPDLQHLRGCPEPILNVMASKHSSKHSGSSGNTQTTNATSISSKARRSSAYDDDFEQHLNDNGIYLPQYKLPGNRRPPKPENILDLLPRLSTSRASLSPSRFDESVFEDFQHKNETRSEGTVMRNVIPIIAGNADIPNEGHFPFTNLESLTSETTVKPVPDYFDGARVRDIHHQVRRDLSQKIRPTKHMNVPVTPNFFLEAKAPKGGADVARLQACYDGAYGARAVHSLQSYGKTEPVYDGNAYTLSSTYHDGTLKLYAHHPTAPITPGGRPEYHMTQLKAYALTSDRDTFVDGATAFRNARDIAGQYRDDFIEAANMHALQAYVPTSHANSQYLLPEGEPSQASAALDYDNSSTSFATTNSNTDQTSSKRSRQSHSPPSSSADSHLAKSRTRRSTSRRGLESTADTG